MIYFDTAASYPVLPEVADTLKIAFLDHYANSSSSHLFGESVSKEIESVRELLADKIGAYPSEVVFTSGATESNNIALKSLIPIPAVKGKNHIITSKIEHKCIHSICNYLSSVGYEMEYITPDENAVVTSNSISKAIRPETALVSIMHVNNELGSVNPIQEIGAICEANDILFHTDAAQSFCKLDIDVDDMNIDILSLSGHKIGGPKGIGAVYVRDLRKRQLIPVIHGAGQEDGLRGGTVASPLISGFGKAIECFADYYETFKNDNSKEYFCEQLEKNGIDFRVNGENCLPHILSITLPGTNVPLLIRENENELSLAQGSACSSKEIEPSHVLSAIGLNRELADRTLRISFTLDVTTKELESLVEKIVANT